MTRKRMYFLHMYLIKKLPYELNDDIIIHILNTEIFDCVTSPLLDLVVKFNRFWAISQIYREVIEEKIIELPETVLMKIIKFMTVSQKNMLLESTKYADIVRLLLVDPYVDPSTNAIFEASRHGHFEVVKLLLKDPRVDPSVRMNEAIRWASENGHIEVVKLLLKDPRLGF